MIHQMVLNVGFVGYSEETNNCLALQIRTSATRDGFGVMLADVWFFREEQSCFQSKQPFRHGGVMLHLTHLTIS